jgi:hypothetical protein
MFHAWQFSYHYLAAAGCQAYDGVDEGMATWAAHFVDPAAHVEQRYDGMLIHPNEGWNTADNKFLGYHLWAFDLFLSSIYGDGAIPKVYGLFETEAPVDALNKVTSGGFEKAWPDFTLRGTVSRKYANAALSGV